ncbi:pyruvate kinase [Brucepastera parasyntrophica]|uniref:pyruvate kinase n=1 Tax=Brucepastera parasyntrophica TaxID=2880008 RepID=UPI0021094940|nr:pyruvate kinase [Brucepastera parasyntrophica]ULQ59187.1 pyruvate kinase [Brucepastera parasyntrophica]
MIRRKTKIVCSMGPTAENIDIVCDLLRAGMNVARFNFSHGNQVYHRKNMETVKRASQITGIPCALLLDTKGPEIRTGLVPDDGVIEVHKDETFIFTVDDGPTLAAKADIPGRISLSWKKLPEEIKPDNRILIADGLIGFLVLETDGKTEITCRALNTAKMGSRKNVNVIGVHPDIPILSEQDKKDIEFGIEMGIDYIAASFVSSPADVIAILRFIEPFNSKVRLIAKIENEEGLDNIEDIVAVSAGIMVARGDMGVQLETERIPLAQKRIIQTCNLAGKPVITATQMLDSMIVNPTPTRAELTDVANAIFDGTDAVMLSGETANGAYPVESVKMMTKIALTVEASPEYKKKMRDFHSLDHNNSDVAEIITHAAYRTATEIAAAAIITPTLSGNTARLLSTFRPEQPIIAATPHEIVQRQLLLNWGVVPLLVKMAEDSEEMTQNTIRASLDAGFLEPLDKIVMVAGMPLSSPIMVNSIRVLIVGNVLARGVNGGGVLPQPKDADDTTKKKNLCRVTGRVVRAESAYEAFSVLKKKGGEILVTRNFDMDFIPLLRVVDGLVIENPTDINEETLTSANPNLIWISQVPGAMRILEQGLTVTLDSGEKLIYDGTF